MRDDLEDGLDAIQPADTTDTATAVDNALAKRTRERRREVDRDRRARVRELMRAAESALIGETDRDPDDVLAELQAHLAKDDRLAEVLNPRSDALEGDVKLLFKRLSRKRERYRDGEDVEIPSLTREYRVYLELAKALGHFHAVTDMTRYAPVTLEKLDVPGARSPVEGEPTPIGRIRVGAASKRELEDVATEIPHKDCEHVLVIANPRQGKDSLICRAAGNLKDEHGYKWVSLHDDGRFETSMIAIPNDEEGIRQSLERFGQEPKGYKTDVFVPAIDGLPEELPANHVPFTFGVDQLTTEIVAQLSGVTPKGSTERRITHALNEVEAGSGSVDELIDLLETYAEETSAEVTVTELREGDELDDEGSTETVTRSFKMGEDEVLHECAQSLIMLASEGLLRDAGAETNLDVKEVLADQERVAVLNCNFLPDGYEHLKFLLENIWIRLIYEARDANPHLPRVALEIREIKELAPSTLDRARYSKIAKVARQTLFFLSSQGGSRRIMLLASTQYINDVFKPIRGNMPIKILLGMGEEKISTLERAGFSFSGEERGQLRQFPPGWGMLLTPEGKTYPINWAGARCGLSLGDLEYLNRYGRAYGFRVQLSDTTAERWSDRQGASSYFDKDGRRQSAPPDRGEWYLLGRDVEEALEDPPIDGFNPPMGTPESLVVDELDEDVLEAVLEERREYPIEDDLRPRPVDLTTEQREVALKPTDALEAERKAAVLEDHGVSGVLRDWTRRQPATVDNYLEILRAVDRRELGKYGEIAEATTVSESSIKQYAAATDQLGECLEKEAGVYHLTPVGRRALETDWSAIFGELS